MTTSNIRRPFQSSLVRASVSQVLVALAVLTLFPTAASTAIVANYAGQTFDGVMFRSMYNSTDGPVQMIYTAAAPVETCVNAAEGGSTTMDIRIAGNCADSSGYDAQIPSPKLLQVSPFSYGAPPCGTTTYCAGGAFVVQITGKWAGSIVVSTETLAHVPIDAAVLSYELHGYGYLAGFVRVNIASNFILRVQLLNADGTVVDNKGREVDLALPPVSQFALQELEATSRAADYVFISIAAVNPAHDACLRSYAGQYTISDLAQHNRGATQFFFGWGFSSNAPTNAVLYSDYQCTAQASAKGYVVLVPPGGSGTSNWPYL